MLKDVWVLLFYVHFGAFIVIVRKNLDRSVDMATECHFFGHLLQGEKIITSYLIQDMACNISISTFLWLLKLTTKQNKARKKERKEEEKNILQFEI